MNATMTSSLYPAFNPVTTHRSQQHISPYKTINTTTAHQYDLLDSLMDGLQDIVWARTATDAPAPAKFTNNFAGANFAGASVYRPLSANEAQTRWQALLRSMAARQKMRAIQEASQTDRVYPKQDVQAAVRSMTNDVHSLALAARHLGSAVSNSQIIHLCHDIEMLASRGYIQSVDISVLSPTYRGSRKRIEQKAYRFDLNLNNKKLLSNRPNGLFLSCDNEEHACLRVVIKYTPHFTRETQLSLENDLCLLWKPAYADVSHAHLRADIDRHYDENGFVIQRKVFA